MKYKKNKYRQNFISKFIPLLIIIGIGKIIYNYSSSTSQPSSITSQSAKILGINPNCKIKGNISQNSGKKYYHLEGMEDYESTVIDLTSGERWFCTEEEAIRSGWTKAPK